eukprot:238601_1
MSTEQKHNNFPPNNIDQLIYWMKTLHVHNSYIDRFKRYKYWDWKDLKEDVNATPSFIFYFFKDNLKAEHIYYVVKDIINGRLSIFIDHRFETYFESRAQNVYDESIIN